MLEGRRMEAGGSSDQEVTEVDWIMDLISKHSVPS